MSTRRASDSAEQHEGEVIELRRLPTSKSMNAHRAPSGAVTVTSQTAGAEVDRPAGQGDLQAPAVAGGDNHALQP